MRIEPTPTHHSASGASHDLVGKKPVHLMQRRSKILIAISDAGLSDRIRSALEGTDADQIALQPGDQLEDALRLHGPFELVLASAQLGSESSLQSLARVRQTGDSTPFLVLGHSQGETLRVFVSDGEGVVLSSRMLNAENLARLAADYVTAKRAV